jgi:hypothetical protein
MAVWFIRFIRFIRFIKFIKTIKFTKLINRDNVNKNANLYITVFT